MVIVHSSSFQGGDTIVHFKVVHLALSISCDGPIRGGYTIVGTFMVLWQPSGYTIVHFKVVL